MIGPFALAFVVSVVAILLVKPLVNRFRLIANVGEHRLHDSPTPLTGGIGVFLGFMASWSVFADSNFTIVIISVLALLFLIGLLDDLIELPFWLRFLAQIAVAWYLFEDGVALKDLGRLVSENIVYLGDWRAALSIFAMVGVINAINMIDGLDGLLGALVLIAISSILLLSFLSGNTDWVLVNVIMAGAVFGFMVFNARYPGNARAKIFMGDSGSLLLGLFLAWQMVSITQEQTRLCPPVVALWILAIPLFDTVGVMIRRLIRRLSPFHADRRHTHHMLLQYGLSVSQVVIVMSLLAVVMALTGIGGMMLGMAESVMFFVFLGLFICYLAAMEYAERSRGNVSEAA